MNKGQGRIISRFGARVELELKPGKIIRSAVRRKLRHIVCGDRIQWEKSGGDYSVTAILPRRNTLTRSYFRGRPRTIAANVDQLVIMCANAPAPDWSVLDSLLVAVSIMAAEAVILHHKTDLPTPQGMAEKLEDYRRIGYPVLKTSVREPATLDALKDILRHKTSVLTGQSGTGKSSLTNLLVPGADIHTQALSESSGHGQHTTSVAWLFTLPQGGSLIDSPGIRDFTPPPLPPGEYQHGFPEFAPYREQCRFHNCLHKSEPHCAVREALKSGEIGERRYQSYLKLLQEGETARAGRAPG